MDADRADMRREFVRFAIDAGVLVFGNFKTKAGRLSPYFFNAGLFNSGITLGKLAQFYARTLIAAELRTGTRYDMLFGPAYKGITLASATAIALSAIAPAEGGRNIAFAFNRKEPKDHGEGGVLIGAPLAGSVVIVDDVMSAGTSVRESVEIIRAAGANPTAVLIALDRMERGGTAEDVSDLSAIDEVVRDYGVRVLSIADLDDVMRVLQTAESPEIARHMPAVAAYREQYGFARTGAESAARTLAAAAPAQKNA